MKGGAKVALAVAVGYYLGRHHKLRLAITLAIAGVAKMLRKGKGGDFLQQGLKVLGSSPEVEKITSRLRGDLLEVGKAAAVAAMSRQIDSLSDKLHERAEALRRVPGAEEASKVAEEGVSKVADEGRKVADEGRERVDKLREKVPYAEKVPFRGRREEGRGEEDRAPEDRAPEDRGEEDYEEEEYEEERPAKKPTSTQERPDQRIGGEQR